MSGRRVPLSVHGELQWQRFADQGLGLDTSGCQVEVELRQADQRVDEFRAIGRDQLAQQLQPRAVGSLDSVEELWGTITPPGVPGLNMGDLEQSLRHMQMLIAMKFPFR